MAKSQKKRVTGWTELLFLVCLLLLVGVAGMVAGYWGMAKFAGIANKVNYAGSLTALLIMVLRGTFVRRKGFLFTGIALVPILLVGVAFKIMHWPWANEMLLGSLALIGAVYVAHFATKPVKKGLDAAKLAWVVIAIPARILFLLHMDAANYFLVAQDVLFLVMFFWFTIDEVRTHERQQDVDSSPAKDTQPPHDQDQPR